MTPVRALRTHDTSLSDLQISADNLSTTCFVLKKSQFESIESSVEDYDSKLPIIILILKSGNCQL
jgi:hypothetical protein